MAKLKKNEQIMLGVIGIMIVVFIIMDPYYFIYRHPPVEKPDSLAVGAKPGAKPVAGKPPAGAPPASVPGVPAGAMPAVGAAASTQTAQKRPVPPPIVRIRREPIHFATWGRDPFAQTHRQFDEAAAITNFSLGGISVRGEDRYALVNSQIVRVGDNIGGMQISRIEKDYVILNRGKQTYTLTWGQH